MDHNYRNRRNIGESKNRVCKKTIKKGYSKDRIGEGGYTKIDYSGGTARQQSNRISNKYRVCKEA